MKTARLFLLPTSLARLIERERGSQRFVEGYFPVHDGRGAHVHLAGNATSLVLVSSRAGEPSEDWADLPRVQAEALLELTSGRVGYALTSVSYGSCDILLSRFFEPEPLDLITIAFDGKEEAQDFRPLAWFGPEVTDEAAYQNRTIAFQGPPAVPEVQLANEALEGLLDVLESRAFPQPQGSDTAEAGAPQQPVSPLTDFETLSDPPEVEDSDIEDGVIRRLARSLRPSRS
jgi:CYTH domain-containing protein